MTGRPYADIEELIERSSLGTPHAKALRASVPDDVAPRVVKQSAALGRLVRFGFTEDQAWALADADYDIRFVPFDDVRTVLLGGAR